MFRIGSRLLIAAPSRLDHTRRRAWDVHAPGECQARAGIKQVYDGSVEHYFPNVPGLGNVALSRHAQERMAQDGISENELKEALLRGATTPDGQEVVWREKDGVRVVILRRPTPFKGAMLATTIYRIEAAARARKR